MSDAEVQQTAPTGEEENQQRHELRPVESATAKDLAESDAVMQQQLSASQSWGASVRRPEGRRSSMKASATMCADDDASRSRAAPNGRKSRRASENADIAQLIDSLEWENPALAAAADSEAAKSSDITTATEIFKDSHHPSSCNQSTQTFGSQGQGHGHESSSSLRRPILLHGDDGTAQEFAIRDDDKTAATANEPFVFPLELLPLQPVIPSIDDANRTGTAVVPSKENITESQTAAAETYTTAEDLAIQALTKRRGSIKVGSDSPPTAKNVERGPLYRHLRKELNEKSLNEASKQGDSAQAGVNSVAPETRHRRQRSAIQKGTTSNHTRERRRSQSLHANSINQPSVSADVSVTGLKRRKRRQISSKSRLHNSSSTSITYEMDDESPHSVKETLSAANFDGVGRNDGSRVELKTMVSTRDGGLRKQNSKKSLNKHIASHGHTEKIDLSVHDSKRSMHSEETVKATHSVRTSRCSVRGGYQESSANSTGRRRSRAPSSSHRSSSKSNRTRHSNVADQKEQASSGMPSRHRQNKAVTGKANERVVAEVDGNSELAQMDQQNDRIRSHRRQQNATKRLPMVVSLRNSAVNGDLANETASQGAESRHQSRRRSNASLHDIESTRSRSEKARGRSRSLKPKLSPRQEMQAKDRGTSWDVLNRHHLPVVHQKSSELRSTTTNEKADQSNIDTALNVDMRNVPDSPNVGDSPSQRRTRERVVTALKAGINFLSLMNTSKRELADDDLPKAESEMTMKDDDTPILENYPVIATVADFDVPAAT